MVLQVLYLTHPGLASLKFQLSSEAKIGIWKIDVNMKDDADSHSEPMATTFEVKEYGENYIISSNTKVICKYSSF